MPEKAPVTSAAMAARHHTPPPPLLPLGTEIPPKLAHDSERALVDLRAILHERFLSEPQPQAGPALPQVDPPADDPRVGRIVEQLRLQRIALRVGECLDDEPGLGVPRNKRTVNETQRNMVALQGRR